MLPVTMFLVLARGGCLLSHRPRDRRVGRPNFPMPYAEEISNITDLDAQVPNDFMTETLLQQRGVDESRLRLLQLPRLCHDSGSRPLRVKVAR